MLGLLTATLEKFTTIVLMSWGVAHANVAVPMTASYYGIGDGFDGKPTANCETFTWYALTAAHKTLPFGTFLKVRNTRNGKEVLVRINDRGPFIDGRDLDLSARAAAEIDMLKAGVEAVEVTILFQPAPEEAWWGNCAS